MKKKTHLHGLWIAALLLFALLATGCSAEQVLPEGVSVEVEPRESGPRITISPSSRGNCSTCLPLLPASLPISRGFLRWESAVCRER